MDSDQIPKNPSSFSCEICYYITSSHKDFKKHLATQKHKRMTLDYALDDVLGQKNPKNPSPHLCCCGKKYKYRQGLYKHQKTCSKEIANISTEITEISLADVGEEEFAEADKKDQIISELVTQNKLIQEQNVFLQNTIKDLIPKVGGSNTNSNNINIVHNVSNINFLNDKCKNAIAMDDFIKNIEVDIDDLRHTGKYGLVQGITRIIMENLNKLPLEERPAWCIDKKRGKMAIKGEVSWVEDSDQSATKATINKIGAIQTRNLPKYKQLYPDWISSEAKKDEYVNIVKNATDDISPDKYNKIITNITERMHLTTDIRAKIEE